MQSFMNIDLVSVAISVAGAIVLGFAAFESNRKSITARAFYFFTGLTAFWSIANYISYKLPNDFLTLWCLRAVLFLAEWQAFSLFRLVYVFPKTDATFPRWYRAALLPYVTAVSLLSLSPYTFAGLTYSIAGPGVPMPQVGFGIVVFAITSIGLIGASIYTLISKVWKADGASKSQLRLILLACIIMFGCIIVFNLVLPTVFSVVQFIPLGAIFTLPFMILIAVAILRHGLFHIKAATASMFVFSLAAVSVVEIVLSDTIAFVLFRIFVFFLVLFFGLNLIQSVMREIEQRELIETQERELEVANKDQESLLRFISHEIKGYLAKSESVFAEIAAGSFGEPSLQIKEVSEMALMEMRKGVDMVMYILKASNFKSGSVTYEKTSFDFKEFVAASFESLRALAENKGLLLEFESGEGDYTYVGDKEKMREHVTRNLIDNAIRYTPRGYVRVFLARDGNIIRFAVRDSGIGITPEDMRILFSQGGHGKNSIKVNVHSTGYGLFIAKQVVDAHGGKIWAESEGEGEGARFVVELPVAA